MFQEIFNFKKFSDNLFTGGMPTKEQLKDAASYVQYVINLAPHTVSHALPGEEDLVKSLGLKYFNIPVDWNTPTEENLNTFMDLMDNLENTKVLVHCEANFRASSFVTMYKILRKGLSHTEGLKIIHEIWDEHAFPIWDEFIAETLKNIKKD